MVKLSIFRSTKYQHELGQLSYKKWKGKFMVRLKKGQKITFMRILGIFLIISITTTGLFLTQKVRDNARSYSFSNGVIPRNVLESYLSRSITQAEYLSGDGFTEGNYSYREDDFRMLKNIGAKFIGRSLFFWGQEQNINNPEWLLHAKARIDEMHQFDTEVVFQAAIFECISLNVETISVPAWVFDEFGLPASTRNFSYTSMINERGLHVDQWGTNRSVPDISRLESQMFIYFMARQYMQIGIEAIHFGQVELMGMEEQEINFPSWYSLLARIRSAALMYARRGTIICDAHTPSGGFVKDGKLLFDFHSFPLRVEEVANKPTKGELIVYHEDSLYKRSKGGITPSGWSCYSLPYLVEFDNWGDSDHHGENIGGIWIWGYDEISWFANLTDKDAQEFLNYATNWLAKVDSNGFLQMPGRRRMYPWVAGGSFYRANTYSVNCPQGRNLEETIKTIWNSNKTYYYEFLFSL
jgi:hypothetical protein